MRSPNKGVPLYFYSALNVHALDQLYSNGYRVRFGAYHQPQFSHFLTSNALNFKCNHFSPSRKSCRAKCGGVHVRSNWITAEDCANDLKYDTSEREQRASLGGRLWISVYCGGAGAHLLAAEKRAERGEFLTDESYLALMLLLVVCTNRGGCSRFALCRRYDVIAKFSWGGVTMTPSLPFCGWRDWFWA